MRPDEYQDRPIEVRQFIQYDQCLAEEKLVTLFLREERAPSPIEIFEHVFFTAP
jgi:hypothetical protein